MNIHESDEGFEFRVGDVMVSKLLREPGPTNTMLDILAASIATFAGTECVVVLGFAAGGVVAPLRALDFTGRIIGLDIDPQGAALFDRIAKDWRGDVEFIEQDALRWLEQTGEEPDVIIDDLSTIEDGEVIKPWESLVAIPQSARRVLSESGVYIANILPSSQMARGPLEGNVAQPFPEATAIRSTEYENSFLLGSAALPSADETEAHLIELLDALGSTQADAIEAVESIF